MPRVLPMAPGGPRRAAAGGCAPRKPEWLKVRAPGGERYTRLKGLVRSLGLHTVCEEARCPNIGECWSGGTLTLMLLGDVCTRACRFCDVRSSRTPPPPDPDEPVHVAEAVAALGLDYVVLTMVDRDDLPDGGADHVARTVEQMKARDPRVTVELLSGDFEGDEAALARVARSGADVLAHNVETVERLQETVRDSRCGYARSLEVLERYKALRPDALTKSSLMLGLGETEEEVLQACRDLRARGVDILTIGQYLRPSAWHLPVEAFVPPSRFAALEDAARALGFGYVASGPLVRSSYRAGELYVKRTLEGSSEEAAHGRDRV